MNIERQLVPGDPELGERHLSSLMQEARHAFETGDIRTGITHLSQSVLVAAKGDHNLSLAEVSQMCNRVDTAGALATVEAW
jgi:hypothetical protein